MKITSKPTYLILIGGLFILMSFSSGGFIPSYIKLISGILLIGYAIYLMLSKS